MRGGGSRSSVLRKGAWTAEEDMLLKNYIQKFGEGKWHLVPLKAGLNRCRKSCRLRWLNYLKPDIKRGHFQDDEVDLMDRLHKLLGNRWSLIAGRLPGRTANDVKNYSNTHVVGRSKKEKTDLKEDELASQEGMVKVIKPQACTISKTFVMHPQTETYKPGNVITSSNGGYQNSFNSSLELVSSPTISDGLIKQYFNELFPDQDNEIDERGCSLRSFPRDGEDLHVFGNENKQNSLFSSLIEEDMWEFLEPEQI